jgi:hypothetical protein
MADRDEGKPEATREKMPLDARRRVLTLLSAAVAAPVVTVLFQGPSDTWTATA